MNENSTSGFDGGRKPIGQSAGPELVLVAYADAGVRAMGDQVARAAGGDEGDLNRILAEAGATIRPAFGLSEDRMMAGVARSMEAAPGVVPDVASDLARFYRVDAPADRLEELAERLNGASAVEGAYVKPPAEPAVLAEALNEMAPSPEPAPPATPDYRARQIYLNAAPAGIDALYAHTQPGGRGANVRIVDVEGAWRFTHEDLTQNQGGALTSQTSDLGWRNHGTAVMGEFGGDSNAYGILGICPDAMVRGVSIFGTAGTAAAIRMAADALRAGDILLIELHRSGPGASGAGQDGFIAVEWWPDDFAAIRYATVTRGVIVVEAAGNGARNLDSAIYNTPGAGFPSSWRNPFNRSLADSGAILVGAGAPPPGTHGRNHGPDRSRLDFSNYGASVDAQGWGREVTTTGYGDLQGGTNEDLWYTDTFSGTSSASPIVVGALGCIQGVRRARGITLLTPASARTLLRTKGSPQQDAPGRPATQRIGNRPNLRTMLPAKVTKELVKEIVKEGKELVKEIKEIEQKLAVKDIKDVREKIIDNKIFDGKLLENGGIGRLNPTATDGMNGAMEARMTNVETAIGELAHFISQDLRPDVEGGTMAREEEFSNDGSMDGAIGDGGMRALSEELQRSVMQTKALKEAKDLEKPSER